MSTHRSCLALNGQRRPFAEVLYDTMEIEINAGGTMKITTKELLERIKKLEKKGFIPVISLNKRKSKKVVEKIRSRHRWIIERTQSHFSTAK